MAKGTIPGAMVGSIDIPDTPVVAGDTLEVVSDSTGNAQVLLSILVVEF